MAGAKGAKLAARKSIGAPKKHYCARCVGTVKNFTEDMEAKPVLMIPGRKIHFFCKKGHRSAKGTTILAY